MTDQQRICKSAYGPKFPWKPLLAGGIVWAVIVFVTGMPFFPAVLAGAVLGNVIFAVAL